MTEPASLYFAELSSPVADAVRRSDRPTVLLLPVGATEPHGPHAPLATDSIISVSTCERAARRLATDPSVRALILPPLSYGVTRYGAAFTGAVHIEETTLQALLVDVCRSLAGQGLRRVVVVNNHFEPEHVGALRRAAETLRSEGAAVALLDLLRRRHVERLTEEFRAGAAHGGRYETSLVLADRPELVDVERMRQLPPVAVDMAAAIAAGQTDFLAMGMDEAYCGAPAEATAAEGEATLETLSELLVELVRDVATWD